MSSAAAVYPQGNPARDQWVVGQRGQRNLVSPDRPYAFVTEMEPDEYGNPLHTGTIFLTNKECPLRCLMCDLWKNTLPGPTALGSIPRQIEFALGHWSGVDQLKLYNSGSFFDPQAIPPADYLRIAQLVGQFEKVIVECHPSFLGQRCLDFAKLLQGTLEVAIGLETVDENVLGNLNKRMNLDQFRRATGFLRENHFDARVFLLIAPPFLAPSRILVSTLDGIKFAFDCGAKVVSLIPTRAGNGAMEQLQVMGHFRPPTLEMIEDVFDAAQNLETPGRIFLDLWDIEKFGGCTQCLPARKERLHHMNMCQTVLPRVLCHECRSIL